MKYNRNNFSLCIRSFIYECIIFLFYYSIGIYFKYKSHHQLLDINEIPLNKNENEKRNKKEDINRRKQKKI